jgi:transposase
MSLTVRPDSEVPAETVRVARAAFPKGNPYMSLRDELGPLYDDRDFASLFSELGQPGVAPSHLAIVTAMQYAEGLTDRQAAEAVRSRIDWKYLLDLELTDPGFDYSILSAFRDRLIQSERVEQLLSSLLERFKAKGLLKSGGRQRTDGTHVLAAIRQLNRLECVGETLRQALNEVAAVAPDWLVRQVTPDWFDRYGPRFDSYRLPHKETERAALRQQLGRDGQQLLAALYADTAPPELRGLWEVELLRQVWIQQYYVAEGQVKWRDKDNLPPQHLLIQSPYDPEARNRTKRQLNWTGYTAHFTETCDPDTPNLIIHVETTPATTADINVTPRIHTALAQKELLPHEHLVDTAYVDAELMLTSQTSYAIDLVGPVPPDPSWQAQAGQGFAVACFQIDWDRQSVTCPQGHTSTGWYPRRDGRGNAVIEVPFNRADCLACPCRVHCTKSATQPRMIHFRPQAEYDMLQTARQRQQTLQFKQPYQKRAGIEGTLSQGTRSFELRQARYIGRAKTHLQHVATAVAMNLTRLANWFAEIPKAQTRQSRFAALAPVT